MLPVLDGVVMELQDCALPLLRGESAACVTVCLIRDSKSKVECEVCPVTGSMWSGGEICGYRQLQLRCGDAAACSGELMR